MIPVSAFSNSPVWKADRSVDWDHLPRAGNSGTFVVPELNPRMRSLHLNHNAIALGHTVTVMHIRWLEWSVRHNCSRYKWARL